MPRKPGPRDSGNLLLDRLPAAEYRSLAPMLQPVGFHLRQVLHEMDAEMEDVYFPTTALASLLAVVPGERPVEAATVGREGIVGATASLGIPGSPHRAICQMGGECLRLPVGRFLEALERGPVLGLLLRRYLASTVRGVSRTLACNSLHSVEARACKWLLVLHDQAGSDEFPMTHEFLAYMLGVRRQGVTVAAGLLQGAGLIAYRRSVVTIVDRRRLEQVACGCYAALRGLSADVVA